MVMAVAVGGGDGGVLQTSGLWLANVGVRSIILIILIDLFVVGCM